MIEGELTYIRGEVREVGLVITALCRHFKLSLQLLLSCFDDNTILFALYKEDTEEVTVKPVVKQMTALPCG